MQPSDPVDQCLDRAIGTLMGLACGDAVGTTVEFRTPGSFEPLTDMVGGGPFRLNAGEWTDDTSMALCLAESILDCGGLDPSDQLRRYLLWADEGYLSSNGRCFDIGGTTGAGLERYRRTGEPFEDPANVDQESAANGSLMRLAAVPIRWHAAPEVAAAMAGESSRTTHGATRPVDACRLLGAIVAGLIGGEDADVVLAPDYWSWGPLHPAVEAVARGSWRHKEPPQIRGTGYCIDALEAALWAVGRAEDVEDAILRAANLGDDADTTAAIAGQIAGARWGASAIPARWLDTVVGAARIRSLAEQLFVAGGADRAHTRWPHDDEIHAWWISDGVLAGEYPGHTDRARTGEKLNLLVDAGVRTFVDLTTPADGLEPYEDVLSRVAQYRALELRRLPHPIPDLGVVDDDAYDRIIADIGAAQQHGGVYVHCWGGVGRTGTVAGCWYGRTATSYEEVMHHLDRARAGTRKAHRPCPETPDQRAVLQRRLSL
ncbi:MAG: ADP-ribosylglycohydrolase family protein [Acidimicrobiia bacterium]|nr:ADP-ribosylglycohydrolase family protein [Acidimicrobiia bacterium]